MTGPASIAWLPLAAPLILAVGVVAVLVADLLLGLRRRNRVLPMLAATVCVVAAGGALLAATAEQRGSFCAPSPRGSGTVCAYLLTDTATVLTITICLAAAAVLVLASSQLESDTTGSTPPGEYVLVLLAATLGAVVVAGARDLITIVVGLETLTVPLFAAVALRRNSAGSAEAAFTFLIVSVTSTVLMLLGVGFLYGLTGTMQVDDIAAALTVRGGSGELALSAVAVVLVLAGLAFKVAAVPFHVWAPSTYQGSSVAVAGYLSTVSKAGGIAGLLTLLPTVSAGSGAAGSWIAVLAALSMTIGNVVALRQRHVLRLLAWSGIAQTGYLLVGLAVAAPGSAAGRTGLAATVGYLLVYVLMTVGAFAVLAAVASDVCGEGADLDLDRLRGMGREHPRLAAAFVLFLAGLAGLPPALFGLFGKVVVVRAAFVGGAGWLGVLVVLNAAIAVVYYFRVAVAVYSRPLPDPGDRSITTTGSAPAESPSAAPTGTSTVPSTAVSAAAAIVVTLIAVLVLVAGFAPDLLLGPALR